MSKLFDKAIIYQLAGLYKTKKDTVTKALSEEHDPAEVHRFATEAVATALAHLAEPLAGYDHALTLCKTLNRVLTTAPSRDPADSQWRHLGLVVPMPVSEEIYGDDDSPMAVAVAVAGTAAILIMAEMRERKLPSASVNDKLADRIAAFEKAEGRWANKKDIAMLKDEVLAKMLKHAPITRKRVPILLQDGLCVVFTSSAKLAEEVCGMLRKLFGTWPALPILGDVSPWLKDIALQGIDGEFDQDTDERVFHAADSAKLFDTSGDGGVVTIKDELVDGKGNTLDTLLDAGRDFEVQEMGITFHPDGNEPDAMTVDLKVHKNGIIKKLAIRDLTEADLDRVIERFDGETLAEEDDRALRPMASLYIVGHVIHQLVVHMVREASDVVLDNAGLGFMSLEDREEAKANLRDGVGEDDEWESIDEWLDGDDSPEDDDDEL